MQIINAKPEKLATLNIKFKNGNLKTYEHARTVRLNTKDGYLSFYIGEKNVYIFTENITWFDCVEEEIVCK